MTLFLKELKRVIIGIIFPLTAAGIIFFAYSQDVFPGESNITKPEPGGGYGMKASNDTALIIPEAIEALIRQYENNSYVTYPTGFYKLVKLNEADNIKMGEIVTELSQNNFTEERFFQLMDQADKLLGGGSDFSETWIMLDFGKIPVTYEEALADYGLVVNHDKYTGAHARYFSDYVGIILSLLPVFPVVFLCLRDRKNIAPVLQTRRVSSIKIILSRYAALVTAVMLPVLFMCAVLTYNNGTAYGFENIDILAYFKYALGWHLPTVMAVTALGLFLTTLTGTPIAIAVQLVWWFIDSMGGGGSYVFQGVRAFQLAPRHNSLGKTGMFIDYFPNLVQNRISITIIALALAALSVAAYEIKRRGMLTVAIPERYMPTTGK